MITGCNLFLRLSKSGKLYFLKRKSANDNWVDYTLRYTVDFKRRRITKDALYTALLKAIEQTNGKVQLASATFDIVGLPEVKVNLKNK